MPRKLHWFKWEAAWTWISGMLLLAIVYWSGAPLLDYASPLSRWQGIGVSLGALIAGYLVYRLIWDTPLGHNEYAGAALSWLAVMGAAWGLGRLLSDRAAYLHVGAMFGTIMVSNVWLIIIPNQKKMMAITESGGAPRPELARRSARCSKHNTYMSVPLIFTMISNHFPQTFGSGAAWAVLGGLVLVGWAAAKLIRDVLG